MSIAKTLSNIYWDFHNKRHFFVIAVFSILLNWAGNTFVYENSYNFLYFDMLGTFVAAITLGSIWGIIVALATAILLSSITSAHFIYLAAVNILAGFFWGMLSESGILTILKSKNTSFKSSLKSNLYSSISFVLFAGIGCGLFTALFSSVIRGVIFQNTAFEQPFALYFSQWFKQIFQVADTGWAGLFANYLADTFIEIPDKVLTSFFGIAICLTIFKFNIYRLTDIYQEKTQNGNFSWYKTMLSNFGIVEICIFIVLGIIYFFKIWSMSKTILLGLIANVSEYTLQDYIFLEIIISPLFLFLILLVIKFFMPETEKSSASDIKVNVQNNFNIKNMGKDIKFFLTNAFILSMFITAVYMFILVSITGVTPIEYYNSITDIKASPETLVWLLIMLIVFILIDQRNNSLTETMTLNDELIKRQTVEQISESFDAQKQKLQILELSWSDNTIEFLRSARHDLINELEKSKTGMNELLIEVYDNIIKPYSDSILESQREMRSYVEEITSGQLQEYSLEDLEGEIEKTINSLRSKTSSYISINFVGFKDKKGHFCKINKLFFTAFNNILDNSVYALQKRVLDKDFKALLGVSLSIENEKKIALKVYDNAGGLSKDKISRIYKFAIESSKGERFGEGTMIAKNFIKALNGYITAQNIRIQGEIGLETTIHLPFYTK